VHDLVSVSSPAFLVRDGASFVELILARALDAEPVIFDPTNVVAGIEIPEGDEILALRRLVYGLSYARRTT
ncbi:MAG: hypothetical protein ABJC79_12920, partial [Acidimicrobiia bacterium]